MLRPTLSPTRERSPPLLAAALLATLVWTLRLLTKRSQLSRLSHRRALQRHSDLFNAECFSTTTLAAPLPVQTALPVCGTFGIQSGVELGIMVFLELI